MTHQPLGAKALTTVLDLIFTLPWSGNKNAMLFPGLVRVLCVAWKRDNLCPLNKAQVDPCSFLGAKEGN